ncbi:MULTISPECIES: hypothetical protein [Photobacterium]|nr:hypothetical protein [Photobacterium proteolyticum]
MEINRYKQEKVSILAHKFELDGSLSDLSSEFARISTSFLGR